MWADRGCSSAWIDVLISVGGQVCERKWHHSFGGTWASFSMTRIYFVCACAPFSMALLRGWAGKVWASFSLMQLSNSTGRVGTKWGLVRWVRTSFLHSSRLTHETPRMSAVSITGKAVAVEGCDQACFQGLDGLFWSKGSVLLTHFVSNTGFVVFQEESEADVSHGDLNGHNVDTVVLTTRWPTATEDDLLGQMLRVKRLEELVALLGLNPTVGIQGPAGSASSVSTQQAAASSTTAAAVTQQTPTTMATTTTASHLPVCKPSALQCQSCHSFQAARSGRTTPRLTCGPWRSAALSRKVPNLLQAWRRPCDGPFAGPPAMFFYSGNTWLCVHWQWNTREWCH